MPHKVEEFGIGHIGWHCMGYEFGNEEGLGTPDRIEGYGAARVCKLEPTHAGHAPFAAAACHKLNEREGHGNGGWC